MTTRIQRLLIANRGEIACRIIATCKVMGIETVTVFAADDRDLPHAYLSDVAVELAGSSLAETYLNSAALIDAAKRTGANAIHPGYGFLSENAGFAEAVVKAGLIFVGPPASVIAQMGDKAASRILCQSIGVPTVPGYDGESTDAKLLAKEAEKIGYPVLVKAAAGGGGKGMRIVEAAGDLPAALTSARSEAKNAFGDDRLLLEKYLLEPRHIEVQVFSDSHGTHLHVFERECSIQRRHQKIIEESPSPTLPEATRAAMVSAATTITKHIGYVGAGTVEFILDREGKFYFLEMNTRLQVEHPVTEMVTGLDLVRLQIEVAEGKKLALTQPDIVRRGHAIEVRLYGEDPARDFMPAPGTLKHFVLPQLPHVRCENGYRAGNIVSASYDPMVAKLAAWGATREEATARMLNALASTQISGMTSNRDFLMRVLATEAFARGATTTNFIREHHDALFAYHLSDEETVRIAAAYLLLATSTASASPGATLSEHSAWTHPKLAGAR